MRLALQDKRQEYERLKKEIDFMQSAFFLNMSEEIKEAASIEHSFKALTVADGWLIAQGERGKQIFLILTSVMLRLPSKPLLALQFRVRSSSCADRQLAITQGYHVWVIDTARVARMATTPKHESPVCYTHLEGGQLYTVSEQNILRRYALGSRALERVVKLAHPLVTVCGGFVYECGGKRVNRLSLATCSAEAVELIIPADRLEGRMADFRGHAVPLEALFSKATREYFYTPEKDACHADCLRWYPNDLFVGVARGRVHYDYDGKAGSFSPELRQASWAEWLESADLLVICDAKGNIETRPDFLKKLG